MATNGNYVATWRGQEIPVRVSRLDGRYLVRLDSQAVEVDLLGAGNGVYSVIVAGRSYEVEVAAVEEEFTVLVRNEPYRIRMQDERAARLRAAVGKGKVQAGRRTLTSPMPGRVVRHLVRVGDAVEAGQGLIVVEAMKMENELRAPGPGTVREIRAPEGALVQGGAPLVIIE
jgi:biotin carboxyl carrier protein